MSNNARILLPDAIKIALDYMGDHGASQGMLMEEVLEFDTLPEQLAVVEARITTRGFNVKHELRKFRHELLITVQELRQKLLLEELHRVLEH